MTALAEFEAIQQALLRSSSLPAVPFYAFRSCSPIRSIEGRSILIEGVFKIILTAWRQQCADGAKVLGELAVARRIVVRRHFLEHLIG